MDGFEGEDLIELFFTNLNVQGYIYTALVKLERGNPFVCKAENTTMGSQPEANFISADGEAVDSDCDEVRSRSGGLEGVGFADSEVVVYFDAEFVWEERALIDGAARFDNEIFQEKINFWDGYFNKEDGYILDYLNQKRNESMSTSSTFSRSS